jgi:hypothetical protein
VTRNTVLASQPTTRTQSVPTTSAACANPSAAIKPTHSGENTTPPMLAPL